MKNMNETGKFDMLKNPECVDAIRRVVERCIDERLDVMIPDIMKETGLSEVEVLNRLRGVPAAGA